MTDTQGWVAMGKDAMTNDALNLLKARADRFIEDGDGVACDHCDADVTRVAVKNGYTIPACKSVEFRCPDCSNFMHLYLKGGKWLSKLIKFDPAYIPLKYRKSQQRPDYGSQTNHNK